MKQREIVPEARHCSYCGATASRATDILAHSVTCALRSGSPASANDVLLTDEPMFCDILQDDIFRLETARLWLRWPRIADAHSIALYALKKDPALMAATPRALEEAESFVFSCRSGNAAGRQIALALTLKGKRSEAIGIIIIQQTAPGVAFMSYWLGGPFQGKGLMSEAAKAMVDLAFQAGKLTTLETGAPPRDHFCKGVLEKCSFVADPDVPPPAVVCATAEARFTLNRSSWMKGRSGRFDGDDGKTPRAVAQIPYAPVEHPLHPT